ncbi:MAG TPA: outer membrane beta-barrel protein [Kofleriaceae bacterium]|nr:outer membrane beta-barrel protein [Kofleriaceae bacterium]
MIRSSVTSLALLALLASPAGAEPRVAARGPYAEASAGGATFLGDGGKYSYAGPVFALRGGIDVFSWFSLGARLELESHQADVPPPPEGEYFQIYAAAADGRISVPAGRFGLFAEGGLGLAMVSTNVLAKVALLDPGERVTPYFSAGGGLEYQLANRHYAFGLAGQWSLYPAFDAMHSVGARLTLRYTY